MCNEGPLSIEPNRQNCNLTPLDRQAIASILAGYPSEEMAARIGISEPALKLHIASICNKLGVSNELELILFTLHHRLHETLEFSSPCD
jgi:DNA-binding CsgD family transcriptional regulator